MAAKHTYDIAIAYRIYPGVSKTPFIFKNDKLKLTEVGVRTLKSSLGNSRAKVFFLLDNCPVEYETMILKYFHAQDIEFLRFAGIGNLATFGKQIDILMSQNDSDVVFFAEDDYVYQPGLLVAAIAMLRSKKDVDFITPFDHLDSYTLPIHLRNTYRVIIGEGLHWRTSASTCLTFLLRKNTLMETHRTFRSYSHGNWDISLWFALTKFNIFNVPAIISNAFSDRFIFKGIALAWLKCFRQIVFGKRYTLFQPVPSIATHMESTTLAPNVDWVAVAHRE